jgi:pyochelin biosynthetic protein PchC
MTMESLRSGQWVRRFRTGPAAPTRLICFPHAGGSATFYFPVT